MRSEYSISRYYVARRQVIDGYLTLRKRLQNAEGRGAGEPGPASLPAVPDVELPCSRSGVAGSEARGRRAPGTHAASVCFSAQMAGAAEASRNPRFCLLSPTLALYSPSLPPHASNAAAAHAGSGHPGSAGPVRGGCAAATEAAGRGTGPSWEPRPPVLAYFHTRGVLGAQGLLPGGILANNCPRPHAPSPSSGPAARAAGPAAGTRGSPRAWCRVSPLRTRPP